MFWHMWHSTEEDVDIVMKELGKSYFRPVSTLFEWHGGQIFDTRRGGWLRIRKSDVVVKDGEEVWLE